MSNDYEDNVQGYRAGSQDAKAPGVSGDIDDPILGVSEDNGSRTTVGLCAHHKNVDPKDIAKVLGEVDKINRRRTR